MYMVHICKFHCHGVCHRQHVLKSRLVPSGNRTRLQQEKAYAHYRTPTGTYAHNRDPTGSKQNRIAVWAPTKCPRATDNNTKSLRVPKF